MAAQSYCGDHIWHSELSWRAAGPCEWDTQAAQDWGHVCRGQKVPNLKQVEMLPDKDSIRHFLYCPDKARFQVSLRPVKAEAQLPDSSKSEL